MKGTRNFWKNTVRRGKKIFKKPQTPAASGHDISNTASPVADEGGESSRRSTTVSDSPPVEQGAGTQSANPITSEQMTTSHATNPLDGAPVVPQADAQVALSVTAPIMPPSEAAAEPEFPSVRRTSVQQPSRAPLWHEVLIELEKQDADKFDVLNKIVGNTSSLKANQVSNLFEPSESKPESNALLLRAKAILPSLGTPRVVAMSIASIDPHHLAPMVVAGAFFIIELLHGRLEPAQQRKIRNMLFESVNAINEWISFEANFVKRNNAVEQDFLKLEDQIPGLYKLALQLLCTLLTALDASWLRRVGNKLSAAMEKWHEQAENLKDQRALWTSEKRVLEEKVARLEHGTEVLSKIKRSDDHEESLKALGRRVTSEGRHNDSASWILTNPTFKNWSQNFYLFEPFGSISSNAVPKRVLWINGTYGTGKTTIVYRVVSELQRLASSYLPSGVTQGEDAKSKGLLVVSYFCHTTKRPNYETIIRSIGQKLSLLPDFTIAQAAQTFYSDKLIGIKCELDVTEYEDLVRSLLTEHSKSCNIVLLIDALNECDPRSDMERVCGFLKEIVSMNPHVWILFSSHEQMSGSEKLNEYLEKPIQVVVAAPKDELKHFVEKEISFRQGQLKDSDSIFLKPDHKILLDELQQSLCDCAKGMHIWVQVWLKITLPLEDDNMTVRLEDDARGLLKSLKDTSTGAIEANEQLQTGWQRLWDLGALRKYEKIREGLFRFVLCAFKPLDWRTLVHALRIGVEDGDPSYRKEISAKDIDKISSNFFSKDEGGYLSWHHDSARDFVVRVILNPGIDLAEISAQESSMKRNHLQVAKAFIVVMRDSDHQVWKELRLDPSQWLEQPETSRPHAVQAKRDIEEAQSSLVYLGRYGWGHCQHAADKSTIFDPLWTRVIREMILSRKTAFGLWWSVWAPFYWFLGYLEEILGDYAGERVILLPHVLASLDLKVNSASDTEFEKTSNTPLAESRGEDIAESLIQHAACVSLFGANVLHLACAASNISLLNFMLEVISRHHGGVARVFEFLEQEYDSATPFIWACRNSATMSVARRKFKMISLDAMEILLKFESNCSSPKPSDQNIVQAPSLCLWSQISQGETALMIAVENVLTEEIIENDIIRLLDIRKPCNIDIQPGKSKNTALHYAARYGLFQLVKVLVEKCHAKVGILDSSNQTPLDVARSDLVFWSMEDKDHKITLGLAKVIEYLETFEQSDQNIQPPN